MKTIQILGTGCPKCKNLYQNVVAATDGADDVKIEKITNIIKIMQFDVVMLPALAIDGTVKVQGRIPTADEIKMLINNK